MVTKRTHQIIESRVKDLARIKTDGFIAGESNTPIAVKEIMDNGTEVPNLAYLSNTLQEDNHKRGGSKRRLHTNS